MDDTKSLKDQQNPANDSLCNHLLGMELGSISLPNQDGILLKLNRTDTFRLVIYFYSMTGHPAKKLPDNWNKIPGASGCTFQNCNFRDNYEKFIQLNALPVGISTQSVQDIKEMTLRLGIQFDILSDSNLLCAHMLSLPTFSLENKTFIKRLTIVVENNTIKKVFYPVTLLNKHVDNIIEWLKQN